MKSKTTVLLRAGAIGDLLQIAPALELYKRLFPERCITFICGSSVYDALKNCPHIDSLRTFDDHAVYHGSSFSKAKETLKISGMMKGAEICFVLHEDKRWTIPALLAGIKNIITLNSVQEYKNRMERYSMLITGSANAPGYSFSPDTEADYNLPSPYIVIAPGGARNAQKDDECRRWNGYAELTELITERTDINIVLLGSGMDRIDTDSSSTDLCGKTSLSDAYHIIKKAQLFIGNDSGLLHLACCTDTPKAAVFTATDPQKVLGTGTDTLTITSGVDCHPCEESGKYDTECGLECREAITPQTVLELLYKRGYLK